MSKPIIGITLDFDEKGSFSERPYYALARFYFEAITAAGGLPVGLAVGSTLPEELLSAVDGVLASGGYYSCPPSWYGETSQEDDLPFKYTAEKELIEATLASDTPLFGICAGMQMISVCKGATLHRDVHKAIQTPIDHINPPKEELAHPVSLKEGTKLAEILGVKEIQVNTSHREALKTVPACVVTSATAPDGVVEAIELSDKPFALGVQWHPEMFCDDENSPHFKLMKAFVNACK